jgi:hypothetical protein
MFVFVSTACLVVLYSLFPCDQPAPLPASNASLANKTFGELALATAVTPSNGNGTNRTTEESDAMPGCLRNRETWFSVLKAWLLSIIVESVVSDPVMISSVLLTKASWSFCLCHELVFKNRAVFACCSPLARLYDCASTGIGGMLGLL